MLTADLRLLQLIGPGQSLLYPDLLAMTRHLQRRGARVLVAGPLLRAHQEQLALAGGRWVNLNWPASPDLRPTPAQLDQLRRLLQDFDPNLIHAYGTQAVVAASHFKPPLIGTLADLTSHQPVGWERWRLRRRLTRCAGLIVSAESEQAALRRLAPALRGRARFIHPGVDLRSITADFDVGRKRRSLGVRHESAVIGVVSPATGGVGLETVLQAGVEIIRDFPNVEFLFIGDGPAQEQLVLLAHSLGIGGAVIFRGDRADLPEIIASLNILVIPCQVAGSLSHALQALSQEILLVAAESPALREVIEPVDPEAFVPSGDAAALAAKLAGRLEILPPPTDTLFSDLGLGFSYGDMVVSGAGFDLDRQGLEASWRGDESEMRRAVRRAQDAHSPRRVVKRTERVYAEVLG